MIPKKCCFLLFLLKILITSLPLIGCINYDEVEIEDAYETRSRILMVDGNVWLHAGKDKNITFKTSGNGKIYVEDTDVSRLPDTATFNQLTGRVDNINQMLLLLRSRQDTQSSALRVVLGSTKHFLTAMHNITVDLAALKKWKTDKTARDMRRRGLLVKMTRQIIKINKLIAINACDTNRCSNGGTCIPSFGPKFFCLCPPHYTGQKCEADVDECEVYNGTIAGCQNNGTCVNKHGGFECSCKPGFQGPLCQYQMSSCSKTFELCGPHGHCIENFVDPSAPSAAGVAAYKCICDWGFKMSSDKQNPTCVDVNECESNPCHPGVDCINLPGSFMCSGCPEGYKMDGSACVDVNECESEVPVCSGVTKCHNTIGSYYCDPCPAGYTGDGNNCVKSDVCAENKCNSLAKCKQNDDNFDNSGGYSCFCPDGYVGDGIGESGCVKSPSAACQVNKCVNGAKCRPLSENKYHCDCEEGFFGEFCEKTSACHDSPCLNGGTCVALNGMAFCECPDHFFGNVCDSEEEHCGAHFTHPSGNYTFSMENTNKSSICDFVFNIPAVNSALKINFTWFDKFTQESEGPTDCETTVSNLTLYDGPSDSYPEFGTFCGDVHSVHAPLGNTPITMTGTGAMMRFRGLQGKFSIVWETAPRRCGFRTSKPEGILSVPSNKQDIVCEWFISAPAGKIVQVSIPPIAMHSKDSEKCDQNSLEIYDGYSTFDRHRILETCSSTVEPQEVKSTGPFITVTFISNMLSSISGLETIRGFSLNYKFVTPDRECGAEIDNVDNTFDFNGFVESPNYGSLYPPNMDCTWKINGTLSNGSYSADMVLKLTFDQFDIPSGFSVNPRFHYRSFRRLQPASLGVSSFTRFNAYRSLLDVGSCTNDYLKIHDGDGSLVYEGCNPKKPTDNVVTVNNPAAVMTFHSDNQEAGKGFRLKYEMLCEKQVTGNGTIQTWNFPNGGAAGTCTYIINAPRTHVIHLRILTIGLRVLPMSECFYSPKASEGYPDYIELSGGRSDNTYFNKRYVCPRYPFVEGNWLSVSAVRPLKITVGSSGNPAFTGLSLEYKTTDVGCGGIFSSMSGSISSPNYPEKYLPHMHCVYQVYVSWAKVVKLSFETFDLEVTSSKSCDYDRVEIYTTYHNETVHGDLLGKFCGSMLPPAIFSTTNQMAIVFVSDRSVAGQGFNAKFEAISRNTNCDFTFTAPTGSLVMSEQETSRYEKCTFHIAVHENQRVLIRMHNMTIPCEKSMLSFRNGPAESSPPFSSLPGDSEVCTPKVNYLPVLRSFSNRVTILFKSTDCRGTTFNMTYETIANGCGGRIDGISGVVAAPQYPLGDKKNLKCDWTVAVALGNKVRFALTALDDLNSADQSGFCPVFASNRLDFFNSGRLGSQHLKRFCAKELASEPITSEDNELVIKYAQAGGFQSKPIFGFSGHFTTICNGIVLNDIAGNIQSPGYPHKVYTNQFCSWTIQVPRGNRILVTFHHFNIQHQGYYQSRECQGNLLKVEDTDLAEAEVSFKTQYNVTNLINKYCDRAVPRSIKSKHNTMKLTYTSHIIPTNSFWLSWATLGCSRDITQPGRIIITKDHLDPEMEEFECQYRIKAPIGKKILVKLERFDILPGANCTYGGAEFSGMAVFMGSSNASGVAFQTICTPTNSGNISSQTDQMFVFMTLNKNRLATNDGVFLNATVEFIDDASDTCGGIIELKRGVKNQLVSPGYPGPYPAAISCRWLIRAPEGYHIEYTVEEFHSPNYHEERSGAKSRFPLGGSNVTCRWALPYSDGMLSFYSGNSSKTAAFEKICEESSTPRSFEMYAAESLVVFEGASSMFGQKSGQETRKFNGIRISVRPKCGGVVYAESRPQVISLYHEGEDVCNVTIKKRDPEDSEIFLRIEEYTKQNVSTQHSIDDKIDIYSGGVLKYTEMLGATDTTMQEYASEDDVMLSVQHGGAPHSAVIVYSTDERSCGGEVRHQEGTIFAPQRSMEKAFDCGWTVSNNLGNRVKVSILKHNLKSSPNCTDSYIEVREFNSSGKVLKRQCDSSEVFTDQIEAQVLYIFLRYRIPEDSDDVDTADDEKRSADAPLFQAQYEKVAGGSPKSRFVQNPVLDREDMVMWTLNTVDEGTGILVKFSELYLPSTKSYIRFSESGENGDVENTDVTGLLLPAEKFFETNLIHVYAKLQKTDRFAFTWEPVPLNYRNLTMTKKKEPKIYDCGGNLNPTYDWNYISSPLPPGQSYGYEENVHCRWNLQRPLFTGLELKFEHLDLEDVESCAYDFVSFRLQFDGAPEETDDPDFTSASKHCALAKSNNTFVFSVNRALHIHFVSDRSRHGTGFKLKYRLTCNAFEHIHTGTNFEGIIQSPTYGLSLEPREWKCQYSVIMESNRRLFVEVLDLDIEEKSPCAQSDMLLIGNRYTDGMVGKSSSPNAPSVLCGSLDTQEKANFTSERGRMFIRYFASKNSRKGFKLRITEVTTECPSGVLHIDEHVPKRTLYSPEFPKPIPNSAECEYVMAAPNGHRVMLTFDADNFDIDGSDKECQTVDYVEVRDGPSAHSQMIGRYCGNRPPSSIYSTGNFLFVKLHSSEWGKSRRFVAHYEIATCGGTIIVAENTTAHITSPQFPDPFPSPLECEWNVRSPNTHLLEAKVDHLWLFYNQNCSMERLSILDGNSTSQPLLGPACLMQRMPDTFSRSASRQLTVKFSSNSTATRGGRQYCVGKKCGFDVAVRLSETKCGGSISDMQGSVQPPGFPGRLLPHVRCVWDFKAQPGWVYRFKLNFTAAEGYRKLARFLGPASKKLCFNDIGIAEGIPPYNVIQHTFLFCKEDKYYNSNTDVARVVYDDSMTRDLIGRENIDFYSEGYYMPFSLDYTMVPVALTGGCTFLVDHNETFEFGGEKGQKMESFCHLEIKKPAKSGSVYIKFSNYTFNPEILKDTVMCLAWDAHVAIKSDSPSMIDKMVCETTVNNNQTEMVYVNPNIDIWVNQAFREKNDQKFNLTIEFHDCGGVISSPNTGEITSPNYGPGKRYLRDSHCRWLLEAPEGQVVKIKIVEMRIAYEHDCADDVLMVGEGAQAEMNTIHRYCHKTDGDQEQKLEERFRTIRSKSRHLSLIWATNSKFEDLGWKLQYEFVNENDECGYHTRGLSGTITTPNFAEKDYDNDLECVWDIQVPLGYHVNLKYKDFDVETSPECQKDSLVVSQEHSTRANSPNGDYYFLFQDEQKESALCGIEHPPEFNSESNRIRLNFTTDEKTTARGFRVDWEAQCGGIYRLNHGVITSPTYPEGYPNKVSECMYLIAPADQNAVIALKFSDFDLSGGKTSFGRSPCEEDHVQLIEASSGRMIMSICGGEAMPKDPLIFKGPVGLKFVSDKSFMWDVQHAHSKKNRGFQVAYSMNKCGDNIELREGTEFITTITSPAFPLPYAQELDCVWNITTDQDRFLNVRLESLDLEDFRDCTADYVELFDSQELNSNKSMGKFCGDMRRAPQYRLQSTGPNLLIQLKTDFNVNAGGFKMIVTSTLGEKAGCGGKLTATSTWQTLSSPKDEDGNYPPALMCGWHISGPVGSQLRIRIDGIDTELLQFPPGMKPKPECIDALTIYDGQEFYSPVLAGDICTSRTPPPKMLYTSHRHAFVVFETDRDGTGKGFNISYATVENECGGWLQAESQMKALVFKGITQEDNKAVSKERTHQRCRFMIQGSKTEPVILTFNQFSIYSAAIDCSDAYVEIRDVGSLAECQHPACAQENHERRIVRMCGEIHPPPHISNTNTIQIIISSPILPANNSLSVMVLEYGILDNCNRTLDIAKLPSGRLTSPNYPNMYPGNATCITKLKTRGSKVFLVFRKFALEINNRPSCSTDYLEIREENQASAGRQCDSLLPDSILTNGNDITTEFHSDHSIQNSGYDMTYMKVTKETDSLIELAPISETSGVISSVGYPNGYNSSYTQISFNIPSKAGDCSDSYVEIRDVGSLQECQHPACAREPNQRKITKLCGTNAPTAHISNTNTIQIIVSAEIKPAGNQTRPSFKFEYNLLDSCNRTINTNEIKSGRLTSPNFPEPYTENSTCQTVLESGNQKMLIAFATFELEDVNRVQNVCQYDYLELLEKGAVGEKLCGMDVPSTRLTSGKDVTATFKSDHSMSMAGFDATYFTVVSERDDRIQFADSYEMQGVISSIGYPYGYNKSYTQVFTIRPPASHDCSFVFSDTSIGLMKTNEECGAPTDEYLEIEVFFKEKLRKARVRDCTFKTVNTRELILEADTTDRYVKLSFTSDGDGANDGRGVKIRWVCHSVGRTHPVLR